MMLNKVEIFNAENLRDLQNNIDAWCLQYRLEPLTASISYCNNEYVAAVVVMEY